MAGLKHHALCSMLENNMHLHMTYFAGKAPNVELIPANDVTVVRSAINDDMFNYVLSARFTEHNAAARIEHVIRLFQEHSRPFSWWVGESDTPISLKDELSRHGLIFKEQDVGMILELHHFHPQAASRLNFKQVLQQQDLKEFGSIIQAIGGHPECYDRIYRHIPLNALREGCPLEMHVAYLESTPIATGVLVLDGSIAGIYYVAVIQKTPSASYPYLPSPSFHSITNS